MLHRIATRMQSRRAVLQEAPLQMLHIICEEYGCANEAWRQELDHSIVEMEQRIVMTGSDIDTFDKSINKDEPLIRKLHRTNTNLTWLDCTTNFEQNLLEFSQKVIDLCEATREGQSMRALSRRSRIRVEQEIRSSLNSCSNRYYHVKGLQERAKVQNNTVGVVSNLKGGLADMR